MMAERSGARNVEINPFTQDLQEVQRVTEWLKSVQFETPAGKPTINGVYVKELKVHVDGRGDVIELWSKGWPEHSDHGGWVMPTTHVYQSATDVGVVKAWHLHQRHTDQFTCTRGKLQVVVADIRRDSPTFGFVNSFVLGTQRALMIQIPPGCIHGWKTLTPPEAIVVNFQSHGFDPKDEFKFSPEEILTAVWQPKNG